MPKLRERLLVEKCLLSFFDVYNCSYKETDISEKIRDLDLKLDFLQFLSNNEKENVDYGIKWLIDNQRFFQKQFDILFPIILEYQAYGLENSLKCDPIPEPTIPIEEKPKLVDKIKNFFKWSG